MCVVSAACYKLSIKQLLQPKRETVLGVFCYLVGILTLK